MIEYVQIILILTGTVILSVLLYLRHTAKNFLKILTEIIKMNEMNGYDPVLFIENMNPLMQKLEIKEYAYYLFFLDTEYHKSCVSTSRSLKKFACDQDFTVYVEIVPGKLRWEKSYLGLLLLETIFLLLKTDVNLHLKSAAKAMEEYNRINTFLSHDIKNLAQFINIMEHNLSNTNTPEQREKLFDYLKNTAPSLKKRADKVLFSLSQSSENPWQDKEEIDLFQFAKTTAALLNADITCQGSSKKYLLERKGLGIIFENIIKNFYDKSIKEPDIRLTMTVSEDNGFIRIVFKDTGSGVSNTEKIFEPFYSEKQGGLGIGLYHCRNIANNKGGKLWAQNTDSGPEFILLLKKSG
jgi:signal transduction histidine kinase